jgi:hypothetical protein
MTGRDDTPEPDLSEDEQRVLDRTSKPAPEDTPPPALVRVVKDAFRRRHDPPSEPPPPR